jgi:hypothetical protein
MSRQERFSRDNAIQLLTEAMREEMDVALFQLCKEGNPMKKIGKPIKRKGGRKC